jgi:hypothetical protein
MLHRAIHTNVMCQAWNRQFPKSLIIVGADGDRPMRASIALALLLAVTTSAQAKLAPVDAQGIAISLDDSAIGNGNSGAMREQAYFSAPQPTLDPGRVYLCRMPLNAFEKTRLVRSCN